MTDVEQVRIESDDRGFELHLIVGDDIEVSESGLVVLNIHAVAEELLFAVVAEIGPWLREGLAVKRELERTPFHDADDDEPELGESPMDYYRRTGNSERLFEQADALRKAQKEGRPDAG